jgi:uncharacterized protein YcnI
MRRPLLALALVTALVLLWAAPANAHASFVGAPAGIPTNSDQALTMSVPLERDDTTWNVDVLIAMPAGWQAVGCEQKPTWTCEVTTADGRPVVHFVKSDPATPAEDETFRFGVKTGNDVGTFAVPTLQTYNTGEVVRWIGASGSDNPAPVLTTIAGGTTAPPTVPTTPPTHAPTVPPTTAQPSTPTTAAVTTAAPTTGPASTTVAPSSTTTSSTTEAPGVTVAPDGSGDDGDGGGSAAPWIIGGLVVVAAAAGGGVYFWRCQQTGV